jgi:hypothetical protein
VQVTRQPLAAFSPDFDALFDRWTANGAPHVLHANPIHPSVFTSTIMSYPTPLPQRLSNRPTISSMLQTMFYVNQCMRLIEDQLFGQDR